MKTLTLEGHTPATSEPAPATAAPLPIVQRKRWGKMEIAIALLAFSCTAPMCIGAVSYFANFHATSIAACVFLATSVIGLCFGLAAYLAGWGKEEQ